MTLEVFTEKFNDLSFSDKVAIFNNFCLEHGDSDNMLNYFDEDFFSMAFSNPMEAARATFFGSIESWSDEYIRFNAYGNLESLSEYQAEGEIEYYIEDIFEHPDVWEDYIDDDEDEENEDEDEDED